MPEPDKGPDTSGENDLGQAIALGLCFGLLFGVVIDNLALGLAFGPLFGVIYHGATKRKNGKGE